MVFGSSTSERDDPERRGIRRDLIGEPADERLSVREPERQPADDPFLHLSIGIERRNERFHRLPTLAIVANGAADSTLGELAEVIFDVTDGTIDRARERMFGGKCERSNRVDAREQFTLRLFRRLPPVGGACGGFLVAAA